MQTSKIKIGEVYAWKRGGSHVRFHVTGIVTRKRMDKTSSEVEGDIIEDAKGGVRGPTMKLDPSDLLGPIAEYEELLQRKEAEEVERKAKQEERERQARADRLLLYRFVGVQAPKDAKGYDQFFRCTYGGLDFSTAGEKALVERIREIMDAGGDFGPASKPVLVDAGFDVKHLEKK